jgi:hypothetical protein
MMHGWGHTHVSSAFEVYLVLTQPPHDATSRAAWQDQLAIEPPVWGSARRAQAASALTTRGLRVWSWDDYAVVFSDVDAQPPCGLQYRPWHVLQLEPELPLSRNAQST